MGIQSRTQIHYDRPPELYEQFLDAYMKYSSGLFLKPHDDLDTSARQMLDLHVGFALHTEKPRILEIGPGWGSLYRRFCAKVSDFSYCAVNPSGIQNRYILDKFAYNDISILETTLDANTPLQGKFDLIYFVGSFCHMSDKHEALSKLNKHLSRNGRIIIEDTFFIDSKMKQKFQSHSDTAFVTQEVFGYAEIFSPAQVLDIAADYSLVPDLLQDYSHDHYKTMLLWLDKMEKIDEDKYPIIKEYKKCFRHQNNVWGYTVGNYLLVLKKRHKGPGQSWG